MGTTTEHRGVRGYARLEGNIGYLETATPVAEPADAAPYVAAAMALLADADALIVDLRGSGGDGGTSPSGVSTWSCGAVASGDVPIRLDRPVYLLTGAPAATGAGDGADAADGEGAASGNAVALDFAADAAEALAVAYQHALRKLPPRPARAGLDQAAGLAPAAA